MCGMVPTWSLVLTFVVGLLMGAVASLLVTRRWAPRQPAAQPVAEPAVEGPSGPEPAFESLGAVAVDVVAELERRYQGRKADGG
jgi:hypothetical protein